MRRLLSRSDRSLLWRKSPSSSFMGQRCLATQGWVQKHMTPLAERVSDVEGRLGQNETRLQQASGKADIALTRLDHLRLERRFVMHLQGVGPNLLLIRQRSVKKLEEKLIDLLRNIGMATMCSSSLGATLITLGPKAITLSWGRREQPA